MGILASGSVKELDTKHMNLEGTNLKGQREKLEVVALVVGQER